MGDANDPGVWLQLADDEFLYASSDLDDADHQFFAQTCFHFQQAATLNPFYTETRYPVHWPMHFTREDADRGIH